MYKDLDIILFIEIIIVDFEGQDPKKISVMFFINVILYLYYISN